MIYSRLQKSLSSGVAGMGNALPYAVTALACVFLVTIVASSTREGLATGYAGDSFWTLDAKGRAGVMVIAAVGLSLVFWAITAKTKAWAPHFGTAFLPVDIGLGWIIFAVAFAVSPQVFYIFYQLHFDGLPQQWVISGPKSVARLAEAIDLRNAGQISDDLAGVVFWAIVPYTLWCHIRR